MQVDWIVPDWRAPAAVRALVTTRHGGVSEGVYSSLNLGLHVGDDPERVAHNRAIVRAKLPAEPLWLEQVHGTTVVAADEAAGAVPRADAAVARAPGVVCAVMTADCLPILLCDRAGTVVAAAHAGWRGLAAGVVEATVARMGVPASALMAWLGPAIGPRAFEVGAEVREAFVAIDRAASEAFVPAAKAEKWLADLDRLARLRLARLGVTAVSGGGACTFEDADRFFSYRRDGATGRSASLIWLAGRS